MTALEFEMLVELDAFGRLTAVEVRDDLNPTHTWQGYAARLRSLEKRGFVYRPDPAGGMWAITEEGRRYVSL